MGIPARLVLATGNAGKLREVREFLAPWHTEVRSLDFDDHPFCIERWREPCALWGATESYLDEILIDDAGERMFVCSDTEYCAARQPTARDGGEAP